MTLLITQTGGVARVTLNRPDRHNAFDGALITGLHDAFTRLGQDDGVRVIVLDHAGDNFCAGADLKAMQTAATKSDAENHRDALNMARLFLAINNAPKPVIAVMRGQAIGGGVGLLACCDVVIADAGAKFCLSEVRLGLIPAVISPFVTAKIGPSQARRYMISAERFDAPEALRIGLVHNISNQIETSLQTLITTLLANAPRAMGDIKTLLSETAYLPLDDDLMQVCARRIAARRASPEGVEGLTAFLEKRTPGWAS